MEPHKLSASALKALADARQVSVTEASPFSASLRNGSHGRPEPPAAPLEASFKEAIDIVARPEALVRLKVMVPGEAESAVLGIMVRGGRACRFTIDDDTFELTPPVDLAALPGILMQDLKHEGPLAGRDAVLWPSVVKLLSLLWQATQDPEAAVTRAAALERLAAGGPPAAVEKALDEVVRTGVLEAQGDQLRIAVPLHPWLRLLWSGHLFQVEYLRLDAGTPFDQALEKSGELLLFLGPPGERILSEHLTGRAMEERTQGGKPVEDRLIRLSAPPAPELEAALARLLRAPAGG